LLFSFAAGTFFAGSWYNQHKRSAGTHLTAAKPLYYVDPMHPAYRSDKPGIAPDCGMQLEPVYAHGAYPAAGLAQSPSSLPGSVLMDRRKQQVFGVNVAPVPESPGNYTLRLLGRVADADGRLYKRIPAIDGYIQEFLGGKAGSQVRKG